MKSDSGPVGLGVITLIVFTRKLFRVQLVQRLEFRTQRILFLIRSKVRIFALASSDLGLYSAAMRPVTYLLVQKQSTFKYFANNYNLVSQLVAAESASLYRSFKLSPILKFLVNSS